VYDAQREYGESENRVDFPAILLEKSSMRGPSICSAKAGVPSIHSEKHSLLVLLSFTILSLVFAIVSLISVCSLIIIGHPSVTILSLVLGFSTSPYELVVWMFLSLSCTTLAIGKARKIGMMEYLEKRKKLLRKKPQ
jgi:hypothetical protein